MVCPLRSTDIKTVECDFEHCALAIRIDDNKPYGMNNCKCALAWLGEKAKKELSVIRRG